MTNPPPKDNRQIRIVQAVIAEQHDEAHVIAVQNATLQLKAYAPLVLVQPSREFLLQAIVVPGEKTTEGQIIEAVTLPWFEIIALIQRDLSIIHQIDWRKWEEIIAGAYKAQGFDVILTPRSNDKGRDVIATRSDFGSIRYFDQVKAYGPGNVVTLDQVQSMCGVLSTRGNVSKGYITTTSKFAPGIFTDEDIKRLMPYRLELRDRVGLLEWLGDISLRSGKSAR